MSGASYATLAELRQEVGGVVTTDDAILLRLGRQMTAIIDEYVASKWGETWFIPRRGTWYYDRVDGTRLDLDAHFAEIDAVVDGEGTTLIADDEYFALPRGIPPYTALLRTDNMTWHAYDSSLALAQIAITGDRCYRRHYSEAWVSTTALTAGIDADDTTIAVTTTTQLSPGMLIRIDDEWMSVESGSGTSWVVNRGERGSAAAAHLIGAAVYRFHPEPNIVRAVQRWAGMVYARKGAFEQTRFDGTATVQFPTSIPDEVRDMLRNGGWTRVRPVLV